MGPHLLCSGAADMLQHRMRNTAAKQLRLRYCKLNEGVLRARRACAQSCSLQPPPQPRPPPRRALALLCADASSSGSSGTRASSKAPTSLQRAMNGKISMTMLLCNSLDSYGRLAKRQVQPADSNEGFPGNL